MSSSTQMPKNQHVRASRVFMSGTTERLLKIMSQTSALVVGGVPEDDLVFGPSLAQGILDLSLVLVQGVEGTELEPPMNVWVGENEVIHGYAPSAKVS